MKRVIRAYEYYLLHNKPISKHNEEEKAKKSIYDYEFYVNNERKLYFSLDELPFQSSVDFDGLLDNISNFEQKELQRTPEQLIHEDNYRIRFYNELAGYFDDEEDMNNLNVVFCKHFQYDFLIQVYL